MTGDGQRFTVDDMLRNGATTHRRISELVQQQYITELFPGMWTTQRKLTRWEQLARRVRRRIQPWRERIALRIAPTLHRDED